VCYSDKGTPGDQKGADGVEIRVRAELSFTAPTEYKSGKLSLHGIALQNEMCTNSVQSRTKATSCGKIKGGNCACE